MKSYGFEEKGGFVQVSEKLRLSLLKEEFKLRKKQPQAWTVQKYRKYANIGIRKKKEKPEFIEEEKELETRLVKEDSIASEKADNAFFKKAEKKAKKARKARNAKAKKAKAKKIKKTKSKSKKAKKR